MLDDEDIDPQIQQLTQQLQQAMQYIQELQGGLETQKLEAEAASKIARARRDNAEADQTQIQNQAAEAGLIPVSEL